ncbi:hypothetical protein AT15_07840 [Kosmotoga arenicorallina S304]|uniref:Peptidase MA-like domain-containing protein n=1 Tax=Kosmotoga arenicorallina S304 TaxID=1453497 RepID=A0A176K2X9_9BACT|nr:hypothetical protein [Kosmotoga arenicorallina]OAA31398.1 hypothetical protein AT15_07840 [Kosmotoga arenicorallina S304]
MKRKFAFLTIVFLFFFNCFAIEADLTSEEISAVYKELQNLFHLSPSYSLVIDENAEHSHSVDNDTGYYKIVIRKDELGLPILAHELAHIFFFELLATKNIKPEEIPLWYHELVALWFQQHFQKSGSYRILDFNTIFFPFLQYQSNYPQSKKLDAFYGALDSFAEYLSKRYEFQDFVVETVDTYIQLKDFTAAVNEVFEENIDNLISSWRIHKLIPYLLFLAIVGFFMYLALGRGDKHWRELEFDPKIPKSEE